MLSLLFCYPNNFLLGVIFPYFVTIESYIFIELYIINIEDSSSVSLSQSFTKYNKISLSKANSKDRRFNYNKAYGEGYKTWLLFLW